MTIKKSKRKKEELIQAYSFVAPAVILISVFVLLPIISALIMSFEKVNLMQKSHIFIGAENYNKIFRVPNSETFEIWTQSLKNIFYSIFSFKFSFLGNLNESFKALIGLFIKDLKYQVALLNTIKFVVVVVPLQTFFALVIASILNSGVKGQKFYRVVYFLPSITSSAALTLIFMWLFNAEGLLNIILKFLGKDPKMWMTDIDLVLKVIMGMNIWSTIPFYMTIYLAGLQDIPKSQYEAAEIDGAGSIKRFFHITIPHLKPITKFAVIIGIIGCFQMFDQAFIISNGTGGPGNATLTVVLLIYQYAFTYNIMGYASAMAILLAFIIMITSFVANKVTKEEKLYD